MVRPVPRGSWSEAWSSFCATVRRRWGLWAVESMLLVVVGGPSPPPVLLLGASPELAPPKLRAGMHFSCYMRLTQASDCCDRLLIGTHAAKSLYCRQKEGGWNCSCWSPWCAQKPLKRPTDGPTPGEVPERVLLRIVHTPAKPCISVKCLLGLSSCLV